MSVPAALRPMSIADIFEETFRLYRGNFTLFIGLCAVVEVPLQIVLSLISLRLADILRPVSALGGTTAPSLTQAQANAVLQASFSASVVGLLMALVAVSFVAVQDAALAVVISNLYRGRTVATADAYRAVRRRLGSLGAALAWVFVRLAPIVALSFVLVGIPALVFLAVAWALLPQAIILEGASGIEASGRSRALVSGHWWKSFGLIVVLSIVLALLTLIPLWIVDSSVASVAGSSGVQAMIGGIAGFAASVLVRPIQIVALTLLYFDLKLRKGPLDLDELARASS